MPSDSASINFNSDTEFYDPDFQPLPMQSSWVLDRLNGMELAEAELRGEVPTLTIDLAQGKATGNGGCNRYNGSVKLEANGGISFGQMMSTKMACQSMQLESTYLAFLSDGYLSYRYTPSLLTIFREIRGRRTVLEFKPAR